MTTSRTKILGTLGLAVALAAGGAMAGSTDASADVRIRIGGRAHVRIPRPIVHVRPYRTYWRHRHHWYRPRPVIRIGGSIWLGGYYYQRPFAQPPPPAPVTDCACGPQNYYPVAPRPAPAPIVAAAAEPQAPLPRFGIGAFLGGVSVEGEHEGEDVGLIGQLRLTGGLIAEVEIAKNQLADGARVDRRMLAGLNLELGARKTFAPYLTAGIGTTQVEVEGGWQDNQAIAEIGAGLRWRLSPRLALFGDVRLGSRETLDRADSGDPGRPLPDDTTARAVIPDSNENYARTRIGGMFTF